MEEKKSVWEKMGPILLVVLVVMAFALGSMWSKLQYLDGKQTTPQPTGTQANQPAAAPTASLSQIKALFDNKTLIRFGDSKRKVLFVDISDPSCPYCHIAAGKNSDLNNSAGSGQFKLVADGGSYVAPVPEMKKMVDQGQASYVFIYMPGHGNGEMGTKALYCANEKGKYWQVHDLLMSKAGYDMLNNTVKNDKAQAGTLADFLKPAVNASEMKKCLESDKYSNQLTTDTQLAGSLGVQGTPGFFVNSNLFGGAYNWTAMKEVVDAALK